MTPVELVAALDTLIDQADRMGESLYGDVNMAHVPLALVRGLRELLGPMDHFIDIRDDGTWAIQHPITCRPNLLDCEVVKHWCDWSNEFLDAHAYNPGRYLVSEISATVLDLQCVSDGSS